MGCDVLSLEWRSVSRDQYATSLVSVALRNKGYRVVNGCIFDYRYLMLKHRPRLFMINGVTGARINYDATMFALSLGARALSFVSEGNLRPEIVSEPNWRKRIWGHNSQKQIVEDLCCHWSARAMNLWRTLDENTPHKTAVSGNVGFDRYKFLTFESKASFLARYGREPGPVVGYAAFVFRNYIEPERVARFIEFYGEAQVQRMVEDRQRVNDILHGIIRNNPQITFLLKDHPNGRKPEDTELHNLETYDNVILVKDQEKVDDCIAASDFWLAFESTTCLEAWLMGKETALINPSGPDFQRQALHGGSRFLETQADVQAAIDGFYAHGTIPGFAEKAAIREGLIEDIIQWGDGRNHLRAVYFIEQLLGETGPKRRATIREWLRGLYDHFRFLIAPYAPFWPGIKRFAKARTHFSNRELKELQARYARDTADFDPQNALTEADIEELNRLRQPA